MPFRGEACAAQGWRWGRGSSGPGREAEWGLAGAPSGDSGRCSRLGPETPRLGKGPQTTSLNREGGVANTGPDSGVKGSRIHNPK